MKGRNIFFYLLGIIIVVATLVTIGLLIFQAVPESNEKLLYLLIGQEVAAFLAVVNYFFGSSKGSADKTALLAENGNNNNAKPTS